MSRRHSKKRRQGQREHDEEDEVVDDLAYAATFAFAAPDYSQQPENVIDDGNDDNEIDLGVDDNDEGSSVIDGGETQAKDNSAVDEDQRDNEEKEDSAKSNAAENTTGDSMVEGEEVVPEDGDDDDDDDESDADLVEAVERMTEDEDNAGASSLSAPKTQNELDPYRTPLEKLESDMNFHLTIEDGKDKATLSASFADTTNLPVAGTIRSHLVQDRTVVVESMQGGKLLDEGSLLVMRPSSGFSGTPQLVPLGRIFEVFGPVNQPLYTIRLPQPPKSEKEAAVILPKGGRHKGKSATITSNGPEPTSVETEKVSSGPEIVTAVASSSDTLSPPSSQTATTTGDYDGEISNTTAVPSTEEVDMEDPVDAKSAVLGGKSSSAPKVDVSDEAGQLVAPGPSTGNDSISPVKSSTDQPSEVSSELQPTATAETEKEPPMPEGNPQNGQRLANEKTEQMVVVPESSFPPQEDHWAPNGMYTKFLTDERMSGNNMPVYFIQDEAKLIDANTIMRNSGKGSDASNLYDEEVTNANEIYYSDDEEERQAKNRRKPQQSGGSTSRPTRPNSNSHRPSGNSNSNTHRFQNRQRASAPTQQQTWTTPQGFHQQPAPRGFHPHPIAGAQPPLQQQGFYHHPPASGRATGYPPVYHQQQHPYGMPPPGTYHAPPPPPPPPPPGRHVQGTGYPPPPPPPPGVVSAFPPPPLQGQQNQQQRPPQGGQNAFYYDYS